MSPVMRVAVALGEVADWLELASTGRLDLPRGWSLQSREERRRSADSAARVGAEVALRVGRNPFEERAETEEPSEARLLRLV